MNADTSRAGAGGEENSWETLAEDLFGIDLGADPASDVAPEDLSLDEPESSSPDAKEAHKTAAEPNPAPAAGQHAHAGTSSEKKRKPAENRPAGRRPPSTRPAPPQDDDFGADLDLDEPGSNASTEEADVEIEEEIVAEVGPGEDEGPGESTADESGPRDVPKRDASDDDDAYWDTLKTWQWNEEESESGERSENRDRRGQRGARSGGQRRPGGRERSGPRDRPAQGGPPRSGRPPGRTEGRGERRKEDAPPPRRPETRPERPRRHEPTPPPRSESDEPDSFGAGLLEDQPYSEPARGGGEPWEVRAPAEERSSRDEFVELNDENEVEEGAESTPPSDGDRPPRRRRRRRRSRSRKERPGESAERPPQGESPSELSDESPADRDEEVTDEPLGEDESTNESTDESRGAAEEGRSTGPRPRRRRRRRPSGPGDREPADRGPGDRRGPRRDRPAETPLSESEVEEEFPSESLLESSHAEEDDDDGADLDGADLDGADLEGEAEGEADDEAPRVYRNVPTWEEAIAFLLHRRPGESRGRESEPGGRREFRRDGGRRPERGERPHD